MEVSGRLQVPFRLGQPVLGLFAHGPSVEYFFPQGYKGVSSERQKTHGTATLPRTRPSNHIRDPLRVVPRGHAFPRSQRGAWRRWAIPFLAQSPFSPLSPRTGNQGPTARPIEQDRLPRSSPHTMITQTKSVPRLHSPNHTHRSAWYRPLIRRGSTLPEPDGGRGGGPRSGALRW